jgi:hypothetical protein
MAVSAQISQSELARVASLCYEGNRVMVMLCNLTDQAFNANSTFADWSSIELPAVNGYSRFAAVIPQGAYDPGDLRFEIGSDPGANTQFEASWTAIGTDLTYNRVVIAIQTPNGSGGWVNPIGIHSLFIEQPNVVVFPGQYAAYRIQLVLGQ